MSSRTVGFRPVALGPTAGYGSDPGSPPLCRPRDILRFAPCLRSVEVVLMFGRLQTLFSVAALGLMAVPVYAQEQQPDYGAPAHVAFVDGTATLEREGRTEASA